jgi:hypothetical protein
MMNSKMIRQALVTSFLITVMCIALLVGALLIPHSIGTRHANNVGTMLIAPAYQHQHTREFEV